LTPIKGCKRLKNWAERGKIPEFLQARRIKSPARGGAFFYSDLEDFIISSSFKNSSASSSCGLAFFDLERFGLVRGLGKDITSDMGQPPGVRTARYAFPSELVHFCGEQFSGSLGIGHK
jgi:hypothetical protein